MGIQSKAMFAHQVDYMCDSCNADVMRPTGVVLMSNPPQYPHRCSCGATASFRVQYPFIEYRALGQDAQHVSNGALRTDEAARSAFYERQCGELKDQDASA